MTRGNLLANLLYILIIMKYDVRDYWTEVAERIQNRRSQSFIAGDDTPFTVYQRNKFLEVFKQVEFKDKSVLEVGCGPGGNLEIVSRMNPKRLVGCDISQKMLDLAAENLKNSVLEAEFFLTDGVKLPFADKSIDIAFTVTVLHHNTDEKMLNALVKEICRITKREIYLFENTGRRTLRRKSFIRRSVGQYEAILGKCGFNLVETKYIDVFASYWMSFLISKAINPSLKEGERISSLNRILQGLFLPVTQIFDRFVHCKIGLTKMSFVPGPEV
jgi:SAM-dependent methyltransferase